jgi:glycosyltransferase involved in cell wall biosynthesis
MRVVWLFEYPTLNGGERSLLATLSVLRQQGIEPVALGPAEGPLAAELARQGVEHVPFEVIGGNGRRAPRDALRESLLALLRSLQPAVLHANSVSMGRLSGPVAQSADVPSIAHLRDIVGLSRAAIADLNCHAHLLAVSQATRAFHLRQGVDAQKTLVCYNGVDVEQFRPRPATGWLHQQLGLPADATLVATIGQLILRKGQDVSVRAAAQVKDRLLMLHWLIIGERFSHKSESLQYEADLHAEIAATGLAGRCHFLGNVDPIESVLPELTLLVHPARQEPLGRVLLEAAAAGIACVATDVGGTREIFPQAGQARLVPAGDDRSLAAAVAELVESPVQRRLMADAARRRVELAFDIIPCARLLGDHYQLVAARAQDRENLVSDVSSPSGTRHTG